MRFGSQLHMKEDGGADMNDTERRALNREIAEGLGWKLKITAPEIPNVWKHPNGRLSSLPDFAGDLNAAWEMGERLWEMKIYEYGDRVVELLSSRNAIEAGVSMWDMLQAPALVRARAATEVLRERGAK